MTIHTVTRTEAFGLIHLYCPCSGMFAKAGTSVMANHVEEMHRGESARINVLSPIPVAESVIPVVGSAGMTYEVRLRTDNTASCTCPGWGYRRQCRHIEEAKKYAKNR